MSEGVAAFLLAPGQPPLRLEDREVVIGRSADCDLPLPTDGASRRHAAVRPAGSGHAVRDLGSTNGTLVNGSPVRGEHPLEPGDRIEVAGVSVLYCRMDPAAAAKVSDDGARTVVFGAGAPGPAALRGRLEEIPAYAVLQMLEMGSKSGLLTFEGDAGPVRIWLERGRPVHAEGEKTRGEEAVFAGLRLEQGAFRFEAGPAAPETTLAGTLTALLLEAARMGDEEGR
jgi:hypothetical protein